MKPQTLMILVAGVDIWAILFVLHYQPREDWEVSMVISSETSTQLETDTPIQIWVTSEGVGLWPDRQHTLSMPELQQALRQLAEDGGWCSVRLLCEPKLSLQDWGPTALALSDIATVIRLAPLPE